MEADSGIFEYTYDPVGRLTSAVRGEQVKRYRYDELGNRVREWGGHKYDTADWTQHTFNARNQLVKTQEGEAVKEYRYDGRGNLTNISENGHVKSRFEFDATNMMVGAFTVGKGRAEYTYNGFRNRVGKLEDLSELGKVPDPVTGIIPDPVSEVRYTLDMTLPYDNLLVTKGGPGTTDQSFVWGNSLISASGDDSFFYLQDHLGSPIRLMGEGEADTPLAYDEFGVPVVQAGQSDHKSSNPFGFTGYMRDSVSGIYFAQARYYLPQAGRFNAQDAHWNSENMISGDEPFVFANLALLPHNHSIIQSANLYNYCGSNPLSFIDLTGQVFKAAIAGVGAVVGGVAGATRGVVRGIAAGESIGTVVARGAVGAVSGAAGGAVAGVVLGSTGSIALASAAGGATYGGLYGAGNAIVDGVISGQSAKEIALSAVRVLSDTL